MHAQPIEHAAYSYNTHAARAAFLRDSAENHLRQIEALRERMRDPSSTPLSRLRCGNELRQIEKSFGVLRRVGKKQGVELRNPGLVLAARELATARAMIR